MNTENQTNNDLTRAFNVEVHDTPTLKKNLILAKCIVTSNYSFLRNFFRRKKIEKLKAKLRTSPQ